MEFEQRFNSQNDKLENTGNSCLKSIAENSDMFSIWTEILDDIINDLFLELSNKSEDALMNLQPIKLKVSIQTI